MKALIPVLGTRGDAQPAILLARRLLADGHEVTITLPPNVMPLANRLGVPAIPMGPDSAALLADHGAQDRMREGSLKNRIAAWRELAEQGWDELAEGLPDLAADADLVVTGVVGQELGYALAEKFSIAQAALHYCIIRPSVTVKALPVALPAPVTTASWAAALSLWRWVTRPGEDRIRATMGLPPSRGGMPERMRSIGALEVQAYDPALFPGLAQEWGSLRPLTGFISLEPADDSDGEVPPEVQAFIDAGDPPIYLGVGSMPVKDPAGFVDLVAKVTDRLGIRAILSSGWTQLPAAPAGSADRLLLAGAMPHARVFPQMAAVVHHGGAGSTASGLRAGCPTVVTWISADQPIWGRQVTAAGVGASTAFSKLTPDSLSEALEVALRPATAEAAKRMSENFISPEQAVRRAADAMICQASTRRFSVG